MDKLDQKQRETKLKIAGIDENGNENLEKMVIKYAKTNLGVKLK